MKARKFFTLILIGMISHSSLFGQREGNSLVNASVDSIPKKQGAKTTEIIGIALPAAMITYGAISLGNNGIRQVDYNVHNSLEQNNRLWHTHVEDYLQFSPAAAAYVMKFCKVESTHNLLDMTILYGLSNVLAGGIVQGTKMITGRERPDNSNNNSFPSGHTETAFVAAEFLHQEFKDKSVWISVGGYTVATFVGVARIYNNKHWLSDVITGAGVGILSTKAVYWIYPYLQKAFEKNGHALQTFICPGYSDGNFNLSLSCTF